jgi:hypothetical protein
LVEYNPTGRRKRDNGVERVRKEFRTIFKEIDLKDETLHEIIRNIE